MARADLHDPPGRALADEGVEEGRIEAREPVLVEARLRGRACELEQAWRQRLGARQEGQHAGQGRAEDGLQSRVGDRAHRGGVTMGDEEAGPAVPVRLAHGCGRRTLEPDLQALVGDDRAGAGSLQLDRDPVEGGVVMLRVVVEGDQALGAGGIAEPHSFLPGRMAPAAIAGIFLVGIGGVVDDEVGTGDEAQDVGIAAGLGMLGVGDVADGAPGTFEAVARGTARMVRGAVCRVAPSNGVSTSPTSKSWKARQACMMPSGTGKNGRWISVPSTSSSRLPCCCRQPLQSSSRLRAS